MEPVPTGFGLDRPRTAGIGSTIQTAFSAQYKAHAMQRTTTQSEFFTSTTFLKILTPAKEAATANVADRPIATRLRSWKRDLKNRKKNRGNKLILAHETTLPNKYGHQLFS